MSVAKLPKNETSPSFISFASATFHKMCNITHSFGNEPFMMPQKALIPPPGQFKNTPQPGVHSAVGCLEDPTKHQS